MFYALKNVAIHNLIRWILFIFFISELNLSPNVTLLVSNVEFFNRFVCYRDDDGCFLLVPMSNVCARKIKHVDIHRALLPKTGVHVTIVPNGYKTIVENLKLNNLNY